jgi:hypothetical protein
VSQSCVSNTFTDRWIRRVAGTFVLTSVVLAWTVDIRWLALAAFVGLNLLQFSFTNFCPLSAILSRFDPANKVATATDAERS